MSAGGVHSSADGEGRSEQRNGDAVLQCRKPFVTCGRAPMRSSSILQCEEATAVKKKRLDGGKEEKKGGGVAVEVVKKKIGLPRKGQMEDNDAEKENNDPQWSASPSEMTKRKRVDTPASAAGSERSVLTALVMNGVVDEIRVSGSFRGRFLTSK
jgi:hypothetical protein